MVKKSFLGRLFGKKCTDKKVTKKNDGTSGKPGGGTATLTKDGKGPLSSRVNKAEKDGRFDRKEEKLVTDKRVTSMKTPKPEEPNKRSADKKVEPPPKPIEPEILTKNKNEKVNSDNHKKIDVIAKQMSQQEEVTIKMSEGIKGISSVLSNIDQRMEEQNQQSTELIRSVKKIPDMMKDLPESSRAGVELLQTIGQVLENQSKATADLGKKISGIPDILENLNKKIIQESDDREKERVIIKDSFNCSVDAMKLSMKGVKTSMDDLEKKQQVIVKSQDKNTQTLVNTFKKLQVEQNSQINRLIDKNRMTNKLIAAAILIIVTGLVIYFTTTM